MLSKLIILGDEFQEQHFLPEFQPPLQHSNRILVVQRVCGQDSQILQNTKL